MKAVLILVSMFVCVHGNVLCSEEHDLNYYYEIAKETCHDIPSIRKEMDRVNRDILQLLTERTAYVKRAADLKAKTTKIADDRKRVADQEQKIIDRSTELGLPLEISVPSFRTIMETSIQFNQSCIDRMP